MISATTLCPLALYSITSSARNDGDGAASRRQGYDCADTRVIETRPLDAHHLGKSELAGAVAGCRALDPPLVAEPHDHLGHLGIGPID